MVGVKEEGKRCWRGLGRVTRKSWWGGDILDIACCIPTQRGTGLKISLLSPRGTGGCKREEANLEASLTASSYVIWSSSVCVCVCAGVCALPCLFCVHRGSPSEVRALRLAVGKLVQDQEPAGIWLLSSHNE